MFTLSSNFNLTLSPNTASRIMMSYAFGEALFTSIAGYLMQWIHPMALFGFLFLIAVLMRVCFARLLFFLNQDQEMNKGE